MAGDRVKRRQDVLVKCPYYSGEEPQKVVCEGVEKGSALHVTFASPDQRKNYKNKFCKRQYNDCMICKMLNRKWEYDG